MLFVSSRWANKIWRSWPISRVLSNTSRHPGSHSSRSGVACRLEQPTRGQHEPCYCPPIWSCSGWGLPCHLCYQKCGGLLPASLSTGRILGTRTVSPSPDPTSVLGSNVAIPCIKRRPLADYFSVALSIASRRPVVNRHPALWSPDFPLCKRIAQRLPGQLPNLFYALPRLRAISQ